MIKKLKELIKLRKKKNMQSKQDNYEIINDEDCELDEYWASREIHNFRFKNSKKK